MWPCVVLHLLLLVVVAWRTDLATPWMSDDGAYGAQVRIVLQGDGWAYDDAPTWGTDPIESRSFGKSDVVDGREYPYSKHPVWILALVAGDDLSLPIVGLHVIAVVSAVIAAVLAHRLASASAWSEPVRSEPVRSGPAWSGPAAYAVVALGPPLVWATNLWAHAPAATLGGAVAWALVRWWSRPGVAAGAVLVTAPAVLILVRTEGLLLAVAVGAVVAAKAWSSRREPLALRHGVLTVGAIGGLALAARGLDRWSAGRVAPGPVTPGRPSAPSGWLPGRFTGARATFLDGGFLPPGRTLGLLAIGLLAAGALLVRRTSGGRRIGWASLAAGATVYLVRAVSQADDLIPGLFVAVPILVVGLVALRWHSMDDRLRVLAGFSAVYGLLVVATQYPEGGALEWGGRFMAPTLVALVVLAVAGVAALLDAVAGEHRRIAVAGAALLVLAPVLPALVATNGFRARHGAIVADIRSTGAPVAIATEPQAPLIAWSTVGEVAWTNVGPDGLLPLLERARTAGATDLVIVGRWIDDDEIAAAGWVVDRRSSAVAHVRAGDAPG